MSRSPVRVSEPPRPRTQATAARLAPPDPRKVPYTECGTFRTHRSHPYARGSPNGTAAASAQVHNASARLAVRGAPGLDDEEASGRPADSHSLRSAIAVVPARPDGALADRPRRARVDAVAGRSLLAAKRRSGHGPSACMSLNHNRGRRAGNLLLAPDTVERTLQAPRRRRIKAPTRIASGRATRSARVRAP
jgi:hypothetical protein